MLNEKPTPKNYTLDIHYTPHRVSDPPIPANPRRLFRTLTNKVQLKAHADYSKHPTIHPLISSTRIVQFVLAIVLLFLIRDWWKGSRLQPSTKTASDSIIEGDLYFDFFRLGNFYRQPDSTIQAFQKFADSANIATQDTDTQVLLWRYQLLKKMNLLYKPYIRIRQDNGSMLLAYFTDPSYERLTRFHRKDLLNRHKKVRIKMEATELGPGMVLCTKLLSANEVDGQTGRADRKMLIEDYR